MEPVQLLRFQVAPGCAPNTMSRFVPAAPESVSAHLADKEPFRLEIKLLPSNENALPDRAAREKTLAELLQRYIEAITEYMDPSFTLTMWYQKFGSLDRKMTRGGYSSAQIQQAWGTIEALCTTFACNLSTQVTKEFQKDKPWHNAVVVHNASCIWESKCRDFPSWIYWLSNAALASTSQTILARMSSIIGRELYQNPIVQDELSNFVAACILEDRDTKPEAVLKQRQELIRRLTTKTTASYTPWINGEALSELVKLKLYELGNKFHGYTEIDFTKPVENVQEFLSYCTELLQAKQAWEANIDYPNKLSENLSRYGKDAITRVSPARSAYLQLVTGFSAGDERDTNRQYESESQEYCQKLMRKIESPAKKLSSDLARGAFFIEQLSLLRLTIADHKELLHALARNKELFKIVSLVVLTMPESVRSVLCPEALVSLKDSVAMNDGYLQILLNYQLGLQCPRFAIAPTGTYKETKTKVEELYGDKRYFGFRAILPRGTLNKFAHLMSKSAVTESENACQLMTLPDATMPLATTKEAEQLPACTGIQNEIMEKGAESYNTWAAPACLFNVSHNGKTGQFSGSQLFIIQLFLEQRTMLWREIKAGLTDTSYATSDMYNLVKRKCVLWAPLKDSGVFDDEDVFALSSDWIAG